MVSSMKFLTFFFVPTLLITSKGASKPLRTCTSAQGKLGKLELGKLESWKVVTPLTRVEFGEFGVYSEGVCMVSKKSSKNQIC